MHEHDHKEVNVGCLLILLEEIDGQETPPCVLARANAVVLYSAPDFLQRDRLCVNDAKMMSVLLKNVAVSIEIDDLAATALLLGGEIRAQLHFKILNYIL